MRRGRKALDTGRRLAAQGAHARAPLCAIRLTLCPSRHAACGAIPWPHLSPCAMVPTVGRFGTAKGSGTAPANRRGLRIFSGISRARVARSACRRGPLVARASAHTQRRGAGTSHPARSAFAHARGGGRAFARALARAFARVLARVLASDFAPVFPVRHGPSQGRRPKARATWLSLPHKGKSGYLASSGAQCRGSFA